MSDRTSNKSEGPDQNRRHGIPTLVFVAAAVVLAIAFVAHTYGFRLDLIHALKGFSILEVIEGHANPEAFVRDYPGGARDTTAVSPLVHVYIFLHDVFGISALSANYAMILVEMLFVAVGGYLLWSALADENPGRHRSDPLFAWVFVCLLILLLMSDFQSPNLAHFSFPFFHGQFYGFADGLRLAAIAMVIRHKWIAAGIAFTVCFAIHPIKAVMAMGFVLPIIVMGWRETLNARFGLSVAATLAASGLWYALVLSRGEGGVALEDLVRYSRFLQYHWFPFETGILGPRHDTHLSPFMAITLMSFAALGHTGWNRKLQSGVAAGILVLLLISAFGLWISVEPVSATLIRISPTRASALLTLIAPFILFAAAVHSWRHGRGVIASACLCFGLAAFFGTKGLAPAYALVFALLSVFTSDNSRTGRALIVLLVLGTGAAAHWLSVTYPVRNNTLEAAEPLVILTLVFWGVFFGVPRGLKRVGVVKDLQTHSVMLVTALFLLAAYDWTSDRIERAAKSDTEAEKYLETQLWARENTGSGSLFMVDPCRAYGWRDFSGRASIGTIREWYLTGWTYKDDIAAFEQGKRIAESIGFDIEPFLTRGNSYKVRQEMCATARQAFYRPDMRAQRAVNGEFGVNYFVFDLQHAGDVLDGYKEALLFRNAYFAVLPAEALR